MYSSSRIRFAMLLVTSLVLMTFAGTASASSSCNNNNRCEPGLGEYYTDCSDCSNGDGVCDSMELEAYRNGMLDTGADCVKQTPTTSPLGLVLLGAILATIGVFVLTRRRVRDSV